VARAILAGETKTGLTVFRLVDRMDAGPVLVQRQTMIGPTETCGELHDRCRHRVRCARCDASAVRGQGFPPGESQDESQATAAPKLAKSDGYLRFDEPAGQIALRCRAMWPWREPGAGIAVRRQARGGGDRDASAYPRRPAMHREHSRRC